MKGSQGGGGANEYAPPFSRPPIIITYLVLVGHHRHRHISFIYKHVCIVGIYIYMFHLLSLFCIV